MLVTKDMIDKDLRKAGFWNGLLLLPTAWSFRLMAALSAKARGRNIEGLMNDEVWIPRSDGSTIRTRIFGPRENRKSLPVFLFLHGGGYAIGAPEAFLSMIKDFITARPCIVVAPAYRRSLEAPYPAAVDDAYDVLLWIKNNAEKLGGRDDQIIVGGPSAGGGLTVAIALRARDHGEVNIAFQMPLYPMLDDRMQTESARNNNAPVWSSKHNALGWDFYLRDLKKSGACISQDAAPARATDYSRLPPALTFVGDIEPFRDETINYVNNLRDAGVPVSFEVFKGCFHGFDIVGRNSAVGSRARQFMLDGFKQALDTYFARQN